MIYTGATGRLDMARVTTLSHRYKIQAKYDGMFCTVVLDQHGRLQAAYSRTGAGIGTGILGDLVGLRASTGAAILQGELSAHTERGNAETKANGGRRLIRLFDALSINGRELCHLPYRERHDALLRMQASAESSKDRRGVAHDRRGRFTTSRDVADRMPIVEQFPISSAPELWEMAKSGAIEGLVVVAQHAKAGSNRAKRKCKVTETADCVVLDTSPKVVTVASRWVGLGSNVKPIGEVFTVSRGSHDLSPGSVIEVVHEGRYDSGIPRFPRVSRVRMDLR